MIPTTDTDYDIIIIGAGAAGLAAAVFAANAGKRVALIEKSHYLGGTSAFTAGTLWVPGNTSALAAGAPPNDSEEARKYVTGLAGKPLDDPMIDSYLRTGPKAIEALLAGSEVDLEVREVHPDYFSNQSGATMGYRPLEALTYHNRRSRLLKYVRPQHEELTVFGGMMLGRTEIPRLANIARSPLAPKTWPEYFLALRLVTGHLWAKLFAGRPTRFTMGNALIARLVATVEQQGVTVLREATVTALHERHGRISGLTVRQNGSEQMLKAASGVISATGGFNRNLKRRASLLPDVPVDWSAIADSVTGDLYDLYEQHGAVFEDTETGAFFAPVSLPPRALGEHGNYPHFAMDRGKPGFITVDQHGKRYQNEAMSYNHFAAQMRKHGESALPSWMICDRQAFLQFGIGVIRPGGWGKRRRLKDGYLIQASSLEQLANKLAVPSETLVKTVAEFNADVSTGVDSTFHRGETAYERNFGHPSNTPNPNLGPLINGPYYAIRLYPGDIASTAGFRTGTHAEAVDAKNETIPGLYFIGNDMRSIMGDVYPGPGVTLGPGVVFAYAAVQHALDHTPN